MVTGAGRRSSRGETEEDKVAEGVVVKEEKCLGRVEMNMSFRLVSLVNCYYIARLLRFAGKSCFLSRAIMS